MASLKRLEEFQAAAKAQQLLPLFVQNIFETECQVKLSHRQRQTPIRAMTQ